MHELEQHIAAWRRRMAKELGGREEVLDELEAHLRDGVEALRQEGVAPKKAFEEVAAKLGEAKIVAGEFRRLRPEVFLGFRKRSATVLAYVAGVLGLVCFFWFLGLTGRGLIGLAHWKLIAEPLVLGFWHTCWIGLMLIGLLVLRASRRFLTQPTERDFRGVIAFNLLFLWLVLADSSRMFLHSYQERAPVVFILLGLMVIAWRRCLAHMASTTKRPHYEPA